MKTISFILLLVASSSLFSQSTISPSADLKTTYLAKSKTQRTTGWVLIGTGVVLSAIGNLLAAHDFEDHWGGIYGSRPDSRDYVITPNDNSVIEGVLLIAGASALVGSIPFFIASSRNKHRAMALAFKNQPVQKMQQGHLAHNYMPAVSFTIRF